MLLLENRELHQPLPLNRANTGLLGISGSPIGAIVYSASFSENYTPGTLGLIVATKPRMPLCYEPADDTIGYQVLFRNRYKTLSRLELEMDFLVYPERIDLPRDGIVLSRSPTDEERQNLKRLMEQVYVLQPEVLRRRVVRH